jgi:integrase
MSDEEYEILIPSEYEMLYNNILLPTTSKKKSALQITVDTLLNTGMRYEELRKFADNHKNESTKNQWYDAKNAAIVLPKEATKTKRGRTIHLTPEFNKNLKIYLTSGNELDVPPRSSMNENLRRWSIGLKIDKIPSVKTFRKMWESYLLFAGYDPVRVAANQGHTTTIQLQHYLNFSSKLKSEKEAVMNLTKGWMTV